MTAIEVGGRAVAGEESLSEQQARGEFAFLGLRCREGIEAVEFERRFGVSFVEAFPHSATLCAGGMLEQSEDRWRLTERGRMVSDEVFATFV